MRGLCSPSARFSLAGMERSNSSPATLGRLSIMGHYLLGYSWPLLFGMALSASFSPWALRLIADRLAPEAIPHLPEALNVLTQPLGIAVQGLFQDLAHPFRQLRVQAVVNPLPLATILQQTATAQHGQVPGDLRLCRFQCRGQLTDTQLLLVSHQKNNARPRLIGQAFEYLDWRYEVAAIGGFIWLYLAHAD